MGNIGKTVVDQFFASLYSKETKKWKETDALGIAAEGVTPAAVRVYFNPDKSPKMERVAMLDRKAKTVVEVLHPEKKIFIRKSDSRMSIDFVPCIQPIADNPDHFDLKFKGSTFSEAERVVIKGAFKLKMEDTPGGDEWV
jgi:hypothetical protein